MASLGHAWLAGEARARVPSLGHAWLAGEARAVPKTRAAHQANSYFMELYWKIRSSFYANLLRYKLIQKINVLYNNNCTLLEVIKATMIRTCTAVGCNCYEFEIAARDRLPRHVLPRDDTAPRHRFNLETPRNLSRRHGGVGSTTVLVTTVISRTVLRTQKHRV